MKFIACSDLHITDKRPRNRKGNYLEHILDKFRDILELTVDGTDSNILMVGGDFFDSPNAPYFVARIVMKMIKEYNVEIFVVPGQHDLRYHKTGLDNTPLGILEVAEAVKILRSDKATDIGDGISVVGSGWNEEPEVEADIIVTHRMVVENKALFHKQEEYQTTHRLLHKYKWAKCIISGDNHAPFASKSKGRIAVNCGSMVRSSKTQIIHHPVVWLIDTGTWTFESIELNIKPSKEVFDFNKIEKAELQEEAKKKAEEDIDKFIGTLSVEERDHPKFKNVLKSVIKKVKPSMKTREIINNVMERVA